MYMNRFLFILVFFLSTVMVQAGGIRLENEVETAVFNGDKQFPRTFTLSQNYPNPFRNETTIRFEVKEAQNLKLSVLNVLGQSVRVLENGWKEEGVYEKRFEADDLPSGIYICVLESRSGRITKRMVIQD